MKPVNIPEKIIAPDGREFDIPARGSLGLLALGATGLQAWRKKRAETDKNFRPPWVYTDEKPVDPKEVITIVSGLPRSGTSLMMQMLSNGGMNALTDNKRKADVSNPKGYYEYDPVKNLEKDRKWVPKAKGKTVKVIAQLLQYLPDHDAEMRPLSYAIIFMERELEEVLQSQQVMVGKSSENTANLAVAFKKQVQRMKDLMEARPNVRICYLDYTRLLETPEEETKKIIRFLDIPLDKKKMMKSIDLSLYRNKKIRFS